MAQNVILSDTNSANPKDLRWWSGNIPATNLPKAPTKPLEVKEPIPPLEVTEPTEPVKVTEPTEPVKVSAPSTRPQIDNYELVLRVEDAFSNTQLKSRQALSEYTLTLTSEVNRAFSSDGSQITAYYGSSGEILSINQQPESLTKQSTEQYDYTFSQWNRITVNENDIIMLPEFEVAERSYTVRFTHPDDPDFQATAQYKYGELPQYMGETPIRAATETAVFSFAGWFPQPHAVTGDVTYTAQFNEEQRLYTVSWNILGKTQSRSLPFGASPIIPSVRNEIYEDGTLYTFNGWDKTPSTVTQDVTYTAKFSKETLVSLPTDTEGNVSLYSSDTSYFLTTDAQEAEISELLRRVKADGKQLRINMQDFTLIIPNSAVSSLCSYNTSVLSVISSNEGVGYVFYNFSGSPIRFDSEIRMILPCDEASSDNVYVSSLDSSGYASTLSCSVFEDSVEFISAQSTYYKPVKYYTLSLEYGDGGAVFAPNTLYTKGSTLDLQILPNGEFAVGKVTVTYSDGSFLEYSSAEGLTMPADNVKIKIEFETKKYTIKFICNGELFSTGYFALGEVIEVPDIPLSFEKDGFLYTFIGWSEPISIATKDMTFTAKYFCVNKEDVTPADTQTAVNKVLVDQVLPVVICAVLIAAAITVPLVVVSKKKRASKDADDAQADASAENGKGEDDESEI